MTQKQNSVLLDVDRSIIEKNLLLEENKDEEFENLLPYFEAYEKGTLPYKLVQPTQGICIKTRTSDGDKVFINICHTDEIPCPDLMDDEALLRIWNSDNPNSYRVPLSIGDAHQEPDKSGKPAMAYDVAINLEFFKKVGVNKIYRKFLLMVVMESLQDKFKIELDIEDYAILKNRKAMGKLQMHRIRQQDKDQVEQASRKPLIEELASTTNPQSEIVLDEEKPAQQLIEPEAEKDAPVYREPEYRILRKPTEGDIESMVAELKMDDVWSAREVTLDVGEDRLIVESRRRGYLLDVFMPHSIDQDNIQAQFNKDNRILTVTMPVLAS